MPTALAEGSSERKELEQTSSASPAVLCASVPRTGRISCRTTGTPLRATCQAASDPARPPPTTWIGSIVLMGKAIPRPAPPLNDPCLVLGSREGGIGGWRSLWERNSQTSTSAG